MAVLDELERAEGFTETERTLAYYVLDNASDVAHWSITELAAVTYTSNASIIRLCRKLGVAGFREFRVELAADLEKRRLARKSVDVDYPVAPSEDTASMLSAMATLTREAVNACYAALDPVAIERLAQMTRSASTVYLFAHGDSQVSAESFENMMVKIGVRCMLADRYSETPVVAASARRGDLALFISYRGSYLNNAEKHGLPRILKERGCSVALISSAPKPLWVDCRIGIPARESIEGVRMATFYSQTCIRYILNCLYVVVNSLIENETR